MNYDITAYCNLAVIGIPLRPNGFAPLPFDKFAHY